MSWSKTPTKSETTKKQKYVVPQITNKWGRTEYILTPELADELKRLYPTTMNRKRNANRELNTNTQTQYDIQPFRYFG